VYGLYCVALVVFLVEETTQGGTLERAGSTRKDCMIRITRKIELFGAHFYQQFEFFSGREPACFREMQ